MSGLTKTKRYRGFEEKLAVVVSRSSVSDDLLLRLLFANLITLLEAYLYALTKDLIEIDPKLLLNVARSKKFKSRKIPIHFALISDVRQYFLQLVSEVNFHNLSDIEPLFREAFNVKIPLRDDVLQAIKVRHDIVHRDGFNKAGHPAIIDQVTIERTAHSISELVKAIDRQMVERYAILLEAQ